MVESEVIVSVSAKEEAKAKSKKRSESAKKARATREQQRQRREYLLRKQAILYELAQSSLDSGTESFPYLSGTSAAAWPWPQLDGAEEELQRVPFLQRDSIKDCDMPSVHSLPERLLQVKEINAEVDISSASPLSACLFPSAEEGIDFVKLELPSWAVDGSTSAAELSDILTSVRRLALDSSPSAPLTEAERQQLLSLLPAGASYSLESFLAEDNALFGQSPMETFASKLAEGKYDEEKVWASVAVHDKEKVAVKRARCEYKINLLRKLAIHKRDYGFEEQEDPCLFNAFPSSNSLSHVALDHGENSDTESDSDREFFPDGSRKAAEGTFGLHHFINVDGQEESVDVDEASETLRLQLLELREEKKAELMAKSGKSTRRTRRRGAKKRTLLTLEGESVGQSRGSSKKRATGGLAGKKRKREATGGDDVDMLVVGELSSPLPAKKKTKTKKSRSSNSTPRPSPARSKASPSLAKKQRTKLPMAGVLATYRSLVAVHGVPKCEGSAPKARSSIRRGVNDLDENGEEIIVGAGPTWALFPAIREAFETAGGKEATLTLFQIIQALLNQFGDEDIKTLLADKPLENVVAMALEFLANPPSFPLPAPDEGVSMRGAGKGTKKAAKEKKQNAKEEEEVEKVQVVEFSMPSVAPTTPLMPLAPGGEAAVAADKGAAAGEAEEEAKKTKRGRAAKQKHGMKFVEANLEANLFKWIGPWPRSDSEAATATATAAEAEAEAQATLVLDVLEMLFYFGLTRGEVNADLTAIDLVATKQQKASTTLSETFGADRSAYRDLEEERYLVPERPYTYVFKEKEVVVASMKRKIAKRPAKARPHAILCNDRPGHISVLSLVRDAAARLPGGTGTRPDVATLLRDSQYVVAQATDAKLHQVVSGALDRLHAEADPCVRFYSDQQLWAYLHRRREEASFPTFTGKK